MAGRFSNLELTPAASEAVVAQAPVVKGEPVRTAADHFEAAEQAYRRGRFEPALRMYTRALGENRALVAAWVGQVMMLVELGEYREARLWSDKALELFKNNGDLLAAKALACVRAGDRTSAAASSDAAVAAPGSSALRWRARAEVMLAESKGLAKECFAKALAEANATWFDAVEVARACLFHNAPGLALEFAQMAAAKRASQGYCWLVLGRCQEAMGLASHARFSYARCIELDTGLDEARKAAAELDRRGVISKMIHRIRGVFRA